MTAEPEPRSFAVLDRDRAVGALVSRLMKHMDSDERWRLMEPSLHFDDESEHPEKYATPELKRVENEADGGSPDDDFLQMHVMYQLQHEVESLTNEGLIQELERMAVFVDAINGERPEIHPCFCCSYETIAERGLGRRCPVCCWWDEHPERAEHHTENRVSLAEAQKNFELHGVCDPRLASAPRPNAANLYKRAAH